MPALSRILSQTNPTPCIRLVMASPCHPIAIADHLRCKWIPHYPDLLMNRGRSRRRLTPEDIDALMEETRRQIARNLDISLDRIRYGPLENNRPGRLNTQGDHWQIHYQGQWRELPWHHDGPLQITRQDIRRWHDRPHC